MNCLIVDDEPLARKGLKEFILRNPNLNLLGEARNAEEAQPLLQKMEVGILFLDIEMPRVNGIQLLESRVANPAVIITSAYDQYALKGFELDVQDYLLKPFTYERFCKAVEKASDFLHRNPRETEKNHAPIVFIRSEGALHKVHIKDLLFIEGMQNYMICHTKQGRLIAHITMKSLEDQLPADVFVRTHKSYLANKFCIDKIAGNELIIDKYRVPISRIYKEEALEKILKDHVLNR